MARHVEVLSIKVCLLSKLANY